MAEDPTVEEPKKEPKPETTPASAKDDILAKLNELGIDSLEKIDGMSTASQQAGNLANQLGAVRQELEQLKAQKTPEAPTEYNEYHEGIDLGSAIRKELNAFWNEQQTKQTKAQQEYFSELNQVHNDKRYKVLKEAWDKHFNSITTQQKLSSGQTTPTKEYDRIKDIYTDLLEEQLGKIPESAKPVKPPHMESGETQSIPLPSVDEERTQRISNLIDPAKGFQGTDENIKDLVKGYFPEDDPILLPE